MATCRDKNAMQISTQPLTSRNKIRAKLFAEELDCGRTMVEADEDYQAQQK